MNKEYNILTELLDFIMYRRYIHVFSLGFGVKYDVHVVDFHFGNIVCHAVDSLFGSLINC